MKSRAWLLVLGLVCGCAHKPLAHAPIARQRSGAAQPVALAPLVQSPALGLVARVPCSVDTIETEQQLPDGPLTARGIFCNFDSQEYLLARYFRGARDRAADDVILANAKKPFKTVTREVPITMGEWSGVELEGTLPDGKPAWSRVYAVGDGFWFAQVTQSTGALERVRARAFFDSLVLTQPWSVHAFPEGHFSASLPDGGVHLDKAQLHAADLAVAEATWLGGRESRSFLVFSSPLEPGPASPDERIDHAVEALIRDGNRVVWQGPIVFDEARGRDFMLQGKSTWTRLRIVVTNTDLYLLQATTRTKDGVLDESVGRFFASLRWY